MSNAASQQPNPTNEALRELMKDYRLTRPQVAEFTMASLGAVDRWLLPHESKNYRRMPGHRYKLLLNEIQLRNLPRKQQA